MTLVLLVGHCGEEWSLRRKNEPMSVLQYDPNTTVSQPAQPAQLLNNLETFGAEGGIISEGVAQVIEGLGNPLFITGGSHIQLLISTRLFWSLIQSV